MESHVFIAGKRCVRALSWCLAFAYATGVVAQGSVCKYIDANGNVVFSNLPPEKGQRRISCLSGDEPRKGGSAKNTPTPAGFPKVDADTQRSRDGMRRKVLGDELAAEEKLLAEARTAYANGAPVPLPEEQSNAAQYQARIARLRQSLALHERNVEALKKELGNTQ